MLEPEQDDVAATSDLCVENIEAEVSLLREDLLNWDHGHLMEEDESDSEGLISETDSSL